MAISGELLSADLSNVFQMLSLNRKRGVLNVRDQANVLNQRAIVFDEDRIGLLDVPQSRHVWGLLVDAGDLSFEDYAAAALDAEKFGLGRDHVLREKGLIDEESLQRARRRLQEEELLEIFLWREVAFSLDEERSAEELAERELFNIDLVVMEAARRQDEWLRAVELLGGDSDIWTLPPMPSFATPIGETLSPTERIVVDHIDGVRGTQELMMTTGLPRFHVDLALCRLMQEKVVRRMTAPDLLGNATELIQAGNHNDAIRLLERAIEFDPDGIEIHLRLAEAHLAREEIGRATEHYNICAQTLLVHDQVREAVDIYYDVLGLVPTDFDTLKRALELVATRIEDYSDIDVDLFAQGTKLFHFRLESSQYDEANDLLELLIKIAPNDVGLNLQHARLLVKTGYYEEGADIYLKTATRLFAARDFEGAERIYRSVMGLEELNPRVHAHCEKRIEQIEDIHMKKVRRRRVGVGLFIVLAFGLLLGLGFGLYQKKAIEALNVLKSQESEAVTADDWRRVTASFEDFSSRYPLTPSSRRASEYAKTARSTLVKFEAEEARAKVVEDERRAEKLAQAKENYALAVIRHRERRLRAARSHYEAALVCAGEAHREDWASDPSRSIKDRLDSLAKHLDIEDERLKAIADARSAGELAEAHRLARKLIDDANRQELGDDLVIVDRDTAAQVTLPLLLDRIPESAFLKVNGQVLGVGPQPIELGPTDEGFDVEVSAPGFRTRVFRVDRSAPNFKTTIVLERSGAERRDLGTEVSEWLRVGSQLYGFDRKGELYLLGAQGHRLTSRWTSSRLATSLGSSVCLGTKILHVTQSGLTMIDPGAGRTEWKHPIRKGVAAWAQRGDWALVATRGEQPELRLVNLTRGEMLQSWLVSHPLRTIALCDSGFVGVTEAGRVLSGRKGQENLTSLDFLSPRPRLAALGDTIALTDSDGRLIVLNPATSVQKTVWEPPTKGRFARRGPEGVGRRGFVTFDDGRWAVLDEHGGLHYGEDRLENTATDPSRKTGISDDARSIFVPLETGEVCELDLHRKKRRGVIREANRQIRALTTWQGRIVLSFAGTGQVALYSWEN